MFHFFNSVAAARQPFVNLKAIYRREERKPATNFAQWHLSRVIAGLFRVVVQATRLLRDSFTNTHS